jgi:hypothetical protein
MKCHEWRDAFRTYYGHDLFYAALYALFFLVLRASPWSSLLFLFSAACTVPRPSGRFTFSYGCMRSISSRPAIAAFSESRAPS